jgi:hypothetical protein
MVDYTSDQLIARTIQEITHPDDRYEFQEHVHLLLEGKIPGYHARATVVTTVPSSGPT